MCILQISQCFHTKFVPRLQAAVKAEVKRSRADASLGSMAVSSANVEEGAALPAGTAGASDAARKRKSEKEDEDENEENNEEYQEGKLRFAGACSWGHGPPEALCDCPTALLRMLMFSVRFICMGFLTMLCICVATFFR